MKRIPNGRYTREFREEAVKLVVEEGVSAYEASHQRSRETYGPERLKDDLAVSVGLHRIRRIRKEHGIRCKQKKRYKATTDSRHDLPVAANHLDQKFAATAPNQVWVTDITQPVVAVLPPCGQTAR